MSLENFVCLISPFRDEIFLVMSNTYTQIYIQIVFAVKYRQCLIGDEWKEELHKYITGIIQKYNHKVIAIQCHA